MMDDNMLAMLDKFRRRAGPFGNVLVALEEAAKTPDIESVKFSEVFGRENWMADENSALLQSSAPIVDPKSISHIMTTSFQINHIVSMLNSLLTVALELQEEHQRHVTSIAPKLSKGFSSLPDSVLALIFEFAVRGEARDSGTQAMNLARVSRKFRDIVLREQNLWTTLALDLWQTLTLGRRLTSSKFVSRSGAAALFDVYVDIDPDIFFTEWDATNIRNGLGPTIARWRSLTVREYDRPKYNEKLVGVRHTFINVFLSRIFDKLGLNHCTTRHLKELCFEGDEVNCSFREMAPHTIPLTAPNLRLLRCRHYIPSPSPTFASVTKFSFSKRLTFLDYRWSLTALLTLLAWMPSLVDLDLELRGLNEIDMKGTWVQPLPCICALVTSFQLRVPRMNLSQLRRTYIHSFFRSLDMPRLEALSINVGFVWEENEGGASGINGLSDLTVALLALNELGSFALPSSAKYEFSYVTNKDPALPVKPSAKIFAIPLDIIPSVSTLALTTSNCVVFTRDECAESASRKPVNLSELKFIACRDLAVNDVSWIIRSLQDAKVWSSIDRIVVENCNLLGYEDVVKLVGKERLECS